MDAGALQLIGRLSRRVGGLDGALSRMSDFS